MPISAVLEHRDTDAPGFDPHRFVGPAIACLVMFAIGTQETLHAGITVGDVALILTGALWFGAYRTFRGAGAFLGLGLLTVASGFMLSEYDAGRRLIDSSAQRDSTILMLGAVASIAAVLWARTLLSNRLIGAGFGVGMLVGATINPGTWSTNPWKFAFSSPVSVLVLGLAVSVKRPILGLPPLLALSVVSLAFDGRAYSVTLALAGLVLIWRCLPKRESQRYGWLWTAALIAGGAALVYSLASSLLVSGYLGKDVQARSIDQIQTSGSLILGGRPEITATWALFKADTGGFGVGAVPTPNDVVVAKQGLQSINYDPDNGYVERYLFGGHFELHSVAGDIWAGWGLVGLALVVAVAFVMIRTLSECVSRRTGDALVIYLCLWTLWNLMFSPLPPALPILILGVGLALKPRSQAVADGAGAPAPAAAG